MSIGSIFFWCDCNCILDSEVATWLRSCWSNSMRKWSSGGWNVRFQPMQSCYCLFATFYSTTSPCNCFYFPWISTVMESLKTNPKISWNMENFSYIFYTIIKTYQTKLTVASEWPENISKQTGLFQMVNRYFQRFDFCVVQNIVSMFFLMFSNLFILFFFRLKTHLLLLHQRSVWV